MVNETMAAEVALCQLGNEATMEEIKIHNFIKEFEGMEFPWYETVEDKNKNDMICQLVKSLGIKCDQSDAYSFAKEVERLSVCIATIPSNHEGSLDILSLLNKEGIEPREVIYINWGDAIDCMKLNDVIVYFYYIWYPGVDDIDIFDCTLSWILTVSHYGAIKSLIHPSYTTDSGLVG